MNLSINVLYVFEEIGTLFRQPTVGSLADTPESGTDEQKESG
jgi:hypothetical protein